MGYASRANAKTKTGRPEIEPEYIYHFTEEGMQAHNRRIMLDALKIVGEAVAEFQHLVKEGQWEPRPQGKMEEVR